MRRFVLALAMGVASGAQAQQYIPGERFMLLWDSDGDGVVSVAEATARRDMIFDMFDIEADGVLSAEDYVGVAEHMAQDAQRPAAAGQGQGQMAGRMQAGMSAAFNDADGDGLVSRQEFLDAVPAWIGVMDANGDGVLTRADFGRGARQPGQAGQPGQPGSNRGAGQGPLSN